jgi:hypothetical protein
MVASVREWAASVAWTKSNGLNVRSNRLWQWRTNAGFRFQQVSGLTGYSVPTLSREVGSGIFVRRAKCFSHGVCTLICKPICANYLGELRRLRVIVGEQWDSTCWRENERLQ